MFDFAKRLEIQIRRSLSDSQSVIGNKSKSHVRPVTRPSRPYNVSMTYFKDVFGTGSSRESHFLSLVKVYLDTDMFLLDNDDL